MEGNYRIFLELRGLLTLELIFWSQCCQTRLNSFHSDAWVCLFCCVVYDGETCSGRVLYTICIFFLACIVFLFFPLLSADGGTALLRNMLRLLVALLVKNLYKVLSSADLPWVRILWDNYYNNGKLQQQKKIHSGGVT